MAEVTIDEKQQDSTSSVESEGQTSPDASVEPSTSTAANDAKTETLADVMTEAFKKSTEGESSTSSEKEDESAVLKKNKTPEEEGEQKVDEEAEAESTKENADEKKPSFQDHPDWQKMVKERDTLKQEKETIQPIVEAHNSFVEHWQQNGITPEQVKEIVRFGTLLYTDPIKFKEEFGETWKQITGLTGDTLPADLQEQLEGVDEEQEAGTISKVRADQLRNNIREVAKLRGQQAINKTKNDLSQKQQSQQAQQQFQSQVTSTLSSWITTKQKTDLEFKPAANGSFGKYELFLNNVKALCVDSPVRNIEDVVKIAEKAYTMINGFATRGAKPPTSKVLNTTRSSTTSTTKQPTSMKEVIAQVAAEHGVK